MHRDIDRRNPHLDDPVDVPVGEVGQGDIVAKQKGHPAVVILKIEGFPHPRGHLVYKTEHAFVLAGALLIHQVGFKLQPDVIILPLADLYRTRFASPQQIQNDPPAGHIKAVIEQVVNRVPVDRRQRVTRLYPGPRGVGTRLDTLNQYRHGRTSFGYKNGGGKPSASVARMIALRFHLDDFTVLVIAAVAADPMGNFQFSAVCAFGKCRGFQLPYIRTSFIFARF